MGPGTRILGRFVRLALECRVGGDAPQLVATATRTVRGGIRESNTSATSEPDGTLSHIVGSGSAVRTARTAHAMHCWPHPSSGLCPASPSLSVRLAGAAGRLPNLAVDRVNQRAVQV